MNQFIKFSLTGVLNTFIDYGLFLFLTNYDHLSIFFANLIAYSVAVLNSYLINRYWTFNRKDHLITNKNKLFLFILGNLFSAFISTLSIYILIKYINHGYAKLISIFLTFPINYSYSRFIVFRRRKQSNVKTFSR